MIILSDIHMNLDADKRPLFLTSIQAAVENDKERTLIIAGDITSNGTQREYEEVAKWFHELKKRNINLILAPGNHDTSQSIIITRVHMKERSRRLACLMDFVARQSIVVNRRDEFDMIYLVGEDVFFAARTTHHRLFHPTRVRRKQFEWAKLILTQEGLLPDNGYRLHLVTHQSLWRLPTNGNFKRDKHGHMNKRRRLGEEFLEPLAFSSAINGHNHNFAGGVRPIKKNSSFKIYHIQAPTISEHKARKRNYTPGYVSWDPRIPESAEMIALTPA